MGKALFIAGTGTDVGKTYVTGLIVKKLWENNRNAAYFKAAMSGNTRGEDGILIPGDAQYVKTVSGIGQSLYTMCPYVYENACSPHLASRIEGNPVRMKTVRTGFEDLCKRYEFITVEGSGGILCPVGFDEEEIQLEDVIRQLSLSCILIADSGLGTINAVGLTAEYMRAGDIPVKGIIFNRFHPGDVMEEDNIRMCEHMTGLKTLARVTEGAAELSMDADALAALYE